MWACYLLALIACACLLSPGSPSQHNKGKFWLFHKVDDRLDKSRCRREFDSINKEDEPVPFKERLKMFFAAHWRGVLVFLTPIVCLALLFPPPTKNYSYVAYALCVMAVFWVFEAIPLPVTAFIPVSMFPLLNVMPGMYTTSLYVNDTIIVFNGSLMLAAAIEQSGLHNRLALCAIRLIGYSHYKLLFAMCFMTMFVSMWISNTGATSMMVPIIFSLLKVFESQKLLKMYEKDEKSGELVASKFTVCYFCAATYSATIGGIGTLVGTGTNLVLKGLLEQQYKESPDYLTFPLFSACTVPLMLVMQILCYLCMITVFFGFLRPGSKAAKMSKLSEEAQTVAKNEVGERTKALGPIRFWEVMVALLFGSAIACFFTRSPQIFTGWADAILDYFEEKKNRKYIRDSVVASGALLGMLLVPRTLEIFKNCKAKTREELPTARIKSVLDWNDMDAKLPWSFMFLLGGGFAISGAAGKKYSDLNGLIGDFLSKMSFLPNPIVLLVVIIFTIFLTNFASNVATATVLVPIGMTLASRLGANPLLYNIGIGLAASFCYMLPVGTPGNLVVQSAAKVSTNQMIMAGLLPTLTTTIVLWAGVLFYAPVIWPDLNKDPSTLDWIK